jgi:hypothetical protein
MTERNGCGGQVIDNLKREYNYENIVNWGVNKVVTRTTNQYGIIAHTNTKGSAVTNQRYFLTSAKCVQINDINTVLELKDFVRHKNGAWGAKHGSNDDRVTSLMWALMILHEEIAPSFFDIVEKDLNNKPSIIKSIDYGIKYFINPTSIYTNERNKEGFDVLPCVMGGSQHSDQPELEDLMMQGWRLYQ